MAKKVAEGKIAIYMYIERTNSLVVLEDNIAGFWEAHDHCELYWNKGRISKGNNLLICHRGKNEVKWLLFDPEKGYAEAV